MESVEVVALEVVIVESDGSGAHDEDTCISEATQLYLDEVESTDCDAAWCGGLDGAYPSCP